MKKITLIFLKCFIITAIYMIVWLSSLCLLNQLGDKMNRVCWTLISFCVVVGMCSWLLFDKSDEIQKYFNDKINKL